MSDRFQSLPLDTRQMAHARIIREEFEHAERAIAELLPPGRYAALAMTHLETACMWAIKAISHESQPRQEPPPFTELGPG